MQLIVSELQEAVLFNIKWSIPTPIQLRELEYEMMVPMRVHLVVPLIKNVLPCVWNVERSFCSLVQNGIMKSI